MKKLVWMFVFLCFSTLVFSAEWDYENINYSLNIAENTPLSLESDGTNWWTGGTNTDIVYKLNSTFGYDNQNYSIASETINFNSMAYYDNNWYVGGATQIYQYYSNWTYTGTSYGAGSGSNTEIYNDGTNWWTLDSSTDLVYKYYSNWTYTGTSYNVSSEDDFPSGIFYYNNSWWMIGSETDSIYKYYSNWTYTGTSYNLSSYVTTPTDIYMDNDYYYVLDAGTDAVYLFETIYTAPTIENDSLSASSGVNDAPFTISVDVSDIVNITLVKVEITDPNAIATNYTMSSADNITYTKTYTPSTDGIYTFDFFATNSYGNTASYTSILTYTESTFTNTTPSGGGGGGTIIDLTDEEDDKVVCDINFSVSEIEFTQNNLFQTIVVSNNDEILYDPIFNIEYVDGNESLVNNLRFTNTIDEIEAGFTSSIGLRFSSFQILPGVANAQMVVTSTKCKKFEIPISINIEEQTTSIGTFFNEFDNLNLIDKLKKTFELRFTDKFHVENPTQFQSIMNKILSVGGFTTFLSLAIGIFILLSKKVAQNPMANLVSKTILFMVLSTFSFVVSYVARFFIL